MKKLNLLFLLTVFSVSLLAQAPDRISYQAVIRNAENKLLSSEPVGMRISILQGSPSGTLVYKETHLTSVNTNGLASIEIGLGTTVFGTFSLIDWPNGPYFIFVETDPKGGSNYTISGTSELLAVPYAFHARTAEKFAGPLSELEPLFTNSVAMGIKAADTARWGNKVSIESDPIFNASLAKGITSTDTARWNNKLNAEVDGSVTNEIQTLSRSNDTVFLSNGGFIKLPAEVDGSVTNEIQTLTRSNDTIFLSNGGFIKIPAELDPIFNASLAKGITSADTTRWNNKLSAEVDGSVTNEIQTLSRSNDTIYLSNGGFIKIPAEVDGSVTNEIQTLSRSNDTIFLSNGGFIKIPAETDPIFNASLAKGITGADTARWNNKLSAEVDGSVTNEIQVLSISNDTVFLSNGGFIKLPTAMDARIGSMNNQSVARWNGVKLTNGALYDDSVRVGIGTTAPTTTFHVVGSTKVTGNDTVGGMLNVTGNTSLTSLTATNLGAGASTDSIVTINSAGVMGKSSLNIGGMDNSKDTWATVGGVTSSATDVKINDLTIGKGNGNTPSNTALGWGALLTNSTGTFNTATGESALRVNTTGSQNTATGFRTLYANTGGNNNSAFGYEALYSNTTGVNNTSTGYGSLFNNTGGSANTANGVNSLSSNTTGSNNTANGTSSLFSNTTGNNNTANGLHSLYSNTTGSENTANGMSSLFSNTTGVNNVSSGYQSLFKNTTGGQNSSVGTYSMAENTTGNDNTALGYAALTKNTTGIANTAVGYDALFYTTTGNENTAIGQRALHFNTTGSKNTANGGISLMSITTGNNNTALGYSAGNLNVSGSGNVFLGYQAGYNETGSNKLYIANSSSNPPLIYGDFSTTKLGIGTTTPSATLHVVGSSKVTGNDTIVGTLDVTGNTTLTSLTATNLGAGALTDSIVTINSAGVMGKSSLNIGGFDNSRDTWATVGGVTSSATDVIVNGLKLGRGAGGKLENTALGNNALSSNTSGINNTAVGNLALMNVTSGSHNSGFGTGALRALTSGSYNSAFGLGALDVIGSGENNAAFGYASMVTNNSGNNNSAYGTNSLRWGTTGSSNTALGFSSLANANGNNNTAIGFESGNNNSSGSGNVFLGYRAGYTETGSNKLYIANSSTNPPLIYGDFASGRLGIGTTTPSATFHVAGSSKVTGNDTIGGTLDVTGNTTITSLTATNLAAGALTDSMVTINSSGVIRKSNLALSALDTSNTNEIQTLSIVSDTISLSLNGGQVKLPISVKQATINNDSLYITYSNNQTANVGFVGRSNLGAFLATVVSDSSTAVRYTTANIYGHITNAGNDLIVGKGICYGTAAAPTLANNYALATGTSTQFSNNLTGLAPNTLYYVRTFVTNTIGTSYGNQLSFTTQALTVPTIVTNSIYNVSFTSAMSNAWITDNGGSSLTESGICWSTSTNPTTANSKAVSGTSADTFNTMMTGLTPNTTYYARAYAINAQGTAYGSQISFTTPNLRLAGISTTAVSSISHTTATGGGNVLSDSGSSVTVRGICWSTSTMPTTANSKVQENAGVGVFTLQMTGLSTNTTYYVRAFAINGAGTVYGSQVSFSTPALSAPALTTRTVSGISSNIAGSGGDISSDGGSAITAKGVVWGINTNPTLSNSFSNDGTGAASYNSTLTILSPTTTYYVRAYATNALGTTYGNQLSFTTTNLVNPGPTVPTVGTKSSAMITSSTANSGGYVSSDGGSTITARGICWSTSPNPTLANSFTTKTGSLGHYEDTMTGLTGCGSVFYIRAYATNSTGTGYGNQVTVTTGVIGTMATGDTISVGFYSAIVSGNVIDSGNCPITQKGICWSFSPNPDISHNKSLSGPHGVSFTDTLKNLLANRTYYYRSYATTSVGTFYGPQKTVLTKTPSTLYIGQSYAGGIIFYLDSTGQHGYVCAPNDQGSYQWGCRGTNISGTSDALGSGASNTASILAVCSQTNISAKICDDLVLNGYSDWYLPSKNELYECLQKLGLNGVSFPINVYWATSTQWNTNGANVLSWTYPLQVYFEPNYPKEISITVRAIRTF